MIVRDVMRTEFLTIDSNETVSRLIGQMVKHRQRGLLVFDGEHFLGVAHTKFLLRNKMDAASWKVKRVCSRTATLYDDEDISEAVRKLYASDSPILPVSRGHVVGVLLQQDLLDVMKSEFSSLKASDIMRKDYVTVKEKDRFGKLIEIMHGKDLDNVPVVDNSGKLIGIITAIDVLHNFSLNSFERDKGGRYDIKTKGASPQNVDMDSYEVRNLMETLLWTVKKDTPLVEAIDLMKSHDVMTMPVVDSAGAIVGFFTIRDLLKKYYTLVRPNRSM